MTSDEAREYLENWLPHEDDHEHANAIRQLLAENERLRADYVGGDQEAQARAWVAVNGALQDAGLLSFVPKPLGACGRDRAVQFVSHLSAKVAALEAATKIGDLEVFSSRIGTQGEYAGYVADRSKPSAEQCVYMTRRYSGKGAKDRAFQDARLKALVMTQSA